MEHNRFPPGKIPWEFLADKVKTPLPPEVLLGPGCGEDAALVTLGEEVWAVASDPITFTSKEAGKLSVVVNANDVAVRGAKPMFFTAVVLVSPDEAAPSEVEAVLGQIRETCCRLGVTLLGGHTEVSPGLPRTVISGTMLGKVTGRPLTTGGLGEGDRIGMTRWGGLEGTAILVEEFGDRYRKLHGEDALEEAGEILAGDWISVVPEAALAAANPHVTALHDVTEGGVGEALHEMARAAGRRLDVKREGIPVLPVTEALCRRMHMDPLGLIGSGALLVGCAEPGAAKLEADYAGAGIPFTWIGRAGPAVAEPTTGLPRFERDEVLKAWLLEGIDAFLFDMDGTLIHSVYDWVAIRKDLEVEGHSIIDEINAMESPKREKKWALLEKYEREASRKAEVKDGAVEVLDFLHRKGVKTALVSNNSGENVEFLMEKFGLTFDTVVTRDTGLYKPSAAPLLEAMHRLGVEPHQCMSVGDYLFDVEAGRAAGCRKVCLLYDRRFVAEADCDFPDLRAFLSFLELAL